MDLPAIAEIAHDAGVPLLIDNTFASPYLCRPFEHRRRSRPALGDQVHRRPWRRDRRRAGRQRPLRLGGLGQVPDPDRALCRLSRPRFRRGVRRGRLHHARARRGPARFRRVHEPGQTRSTCCRAWRRCRCACRATSRTRAASSPSSRARPRSSGSAIPNCPSIPIMRWPSACCPRAAAPSSASASRAALRETRARRAGASSRRCACSRISPMSATPSRWSSIRPARRISRWTRPRSKPPASARAWSASRSGSRIADDLIDDLKQALRAAAKD